MFRFMLRIVSIQIYVEDCVDCTLNVLLNADDTNIFVTAKTRKDVYMKANEVLASVEKYMFCNQLHINAAKCNYMYFIPTI